MQSKLGVSQASWNRILAVAVKQDPFSALQLFRQLQQDGINADGKTFVLALQACCNIAECEGSQPSLYSLPIVDLSQLCLALHSDARRKGLSANAFVSTALVNLYGKCGDIAGAENAFAQMKTHDDVAWTSLLRVYVEQGNCWRAFGTFKMMLENGIAANERTFSVMVQACCILAGQAEGDLKHGTVPGIVPLEIARAVHKDALKDGCTNVFVNCALVTVYATCGIFTEAEAVFCKMNDRDVVAWNAMLSAYVMKEKSENALRLYSMMQAEVSVRPNNRTLVVACQACCILAEKEQPTLVEGLFVKEVSLNIGRTLHADAKFYGVASDAFVGSVLVNLYGKCGSILEAEVLFDQLSYSSTAIWNAMLSAYTDGDQGEKALFLYARMLERGANLNAITFKCILGVCSELGCLDICLQAHCTIVSGGFMDTPLATTLMHGYGNCACMEDAKATFSILYHPDTVSWNALCAGHCREGSFIESMQTFDEMQQANSEPDDVSYLSLMSVCNHAGLVLVGLMCWMQAPGTFSNSKYIASVIDLLGRAGDFNRIDNMCFQWQKCLDAAALLCLLRACQGHGNKTLGQMVFSQVLLLQSQEASAYVLMSNIFADAALWAEIIEDVEA